MQKHQKQCTSGFGSCRPASAGKQCGLMAIHTSLGEVDSWHSPPTASSTFWYVLYHLVTLSWFLVFQYACLCHLASKRFEAPTNKKISRVLGLSRHGKYQNILSRRAFLIFFVLVPANTQATTAKWPCKLGPGIMLLANNYFRTTLSCKVKWY